MNGIDVVISALNTDGTTTLSESMPLIIEANVRSNPSSSEEKISYSQIR